MDVKKVLKEMRKKAGLSLDETAHGMGWAKSTLVNKYAQNDLKVNNLAKYADVCGYDLVLRPKQLGASHLEGCIIIQPDE